MSGPSRELPPLVVKILGDNSDAIKAIKGVVTAAKAAGTAVGNVVIHQASAINAAMATSIASYKKLAKAQEQYGRLTSTFRNIRGGKAGKGGSDLDALVGQANKRAVSAYTERVRRMRQLDKAANQDVVASNKKSQATIRDEQQQTVRFFRANAKAVHSDSVQNYGRLTPAFRGMKGAGTARSGMDLDALVGNAEKTAKAVASTENKVMAKADRDRAQSVIGARNAQRKQAAEANKEAADAVKEKLRRDKQLDKSAKKAREDDDRASKKRWQIWGRDAAQNIKNDNETIASNNRVSRQRWVTFGRDAAQNIRNDDKAIRDTNRAAENKIKTIQAIQDHFKQARNEQLKAGVKESLQNAKHDEAAINSTKKANESKARGLQGIRDFFAKAHKERLQQMGRELTQQAKNDAADIRYRRAQERAAARANGAGGGLGGRADIYMHSSALSNIGGGIKSVMEPWAQLESHIATIKVFAGTIENARIIADDMQQFALVSPYTLNSVMEATGLLMKFGQTGEDATATVKMLGDVAGGSSERLKHVALGVAQAVSLGRLQGQELRQMTEGGFNPLRIAAEHASGIGVKAKYTDDEEKAIKAKMGYFDDLMRKRKLDAKFVTAALKLTTSKGGRHAGAVIEQSKTPIGLATQVMESISLVSIEAVKLFDKEIRALLQSVLDTVTAFIKWMKANKDTVASIAITVAYIVGAMIAFHTLGLVVAWVGWVYRSMIILLAVLSTSYRVLSATLAIVSTLFTAAGRSALIAGIQMAFAWVVALGPIALVIAGVVALAMAIWYLRSQNGLVGMFQDAMWWGSTLIGFFWNFGHNMQNIFGFIGANWHLLLADMLLTAAPILTIFEYMTGMDLRSMATGVEKGTVNSGYDMSMLKLDGPSPLGFLDPYKTQDAGITVPDKPNINFEDYITAGKDGAYGKKAHVEKTRDHALSGSNEQAQRMYDYTQAMTGSTGAVTKDNAPMKQVALLEQLVKNTQPDFDRGDSIGDMDID